MYTLPLWKLLLCILLNSVRINVPFSLQKERDESIRMLGGELPLVSQEEHCKVLEATGVDVDGE